MSYLDGYDTEYSVGKAATLDAQPQRPALLSGAQRGEIAYQLTKRIIIDMPTARSIVDAAIEAAVLDEPTAMEKQMARCLGFFASVIKAGEPWSETCQQEYDAALTRPGA